MIVSNTTLSRENLRDSNAAEQGGLSGTPSVRAVDPGACVTSAARPQRQAPSGGGRRGVERRNRLCQDHRRRVSCTTLHKPYICRSGTSSARSKTGLESGPRTRRLHVGRRGRRRQRPDDHSSGHARPIDQHKRDTDMDVTIYHNPRCSKSRQTLKLLEEHGIEPHRRRISRYAAKRRRPDRNPAQDGRRAARHHAQERKGL